MNNISRVVLVVGLVGVANSLSAQTCNGTASYNAGPMRVGAGYQSTVGSQANAGVKDYGLEFGMGAQNGLYGSASYERVSPDGASGMNGFGLNGGWSFDMNQTKSVQVCPVAGFSYVKLPDQAGASGNLHTWDFGGTAGMTMPMSATYDFIPFAGAAYQMATTSASGNGITASTETKWWDISLGAGFVMNKNFTIRPEFILPVGTENGVVVDNRFQLAFSYNFGNASASAPARRR